MSQKQMLSSSPQGGFSLIGLQPALGWTVILGFLLFTTLGIVAGLGSITRYGFPVGCFVVGLFLYLRYPILYLGFNWWTWFLTPLVARLVDFRGEWDPSRLMIVSSYLVTLITAITFFRYFPKSYRHGGLPFILAFVGVAYGFLIGLINNPLVGTVRALLDWITPIFFGFHVFIHWRDYPEYRQNILRTFTWCVLITGAYGVVQYLVAPEWDKLWIIKTGLVTNGKPEPLGIRVFSTMHSPGPFANVMLAGLLLLFNGQGFVRIPASVVGYLSFLLCLVRSAWGGWIVGMFTLLTSLKSRLQMRLIITMLVMVLCVLPFATVEPFSDIISDRLTSITNIQNDTSYYERSARYNEKLNLALSNLLGNGIGSVYFVNDKGRLEQVVLDSGVLDTFFTLGWFGAIPYLGGIALLVINLFRSKEGRSDTFLSASRAIGLGIFSQLWLGSNMLGLSGIILWSFFGIAMAARRYYQHQRALILHNIQQQN